MKLRNLMGAFLALAGLAIVAAPQTAHADPAQGAIYSIDLVSKYGGRIPTAEDPLRVGETATIRVRLANSNWSNPSRQSTPRPWKLTQTSPGSSELYPLELGIMLGGQKVYAAYFDSAEVASPAATYTDFFFTYTVRSGDLALPANLMDTSEKAAGENGTPEYFLTHKDMWEITNDDGDELIASGLFHFTTQGAAMPGVPGEKQNYCVSGRGMGLYIQTVDLDRNYVEPSETEGGKDIWRRIYQGMTTTTTILPSVVVDGPQAQAETCFMYVWCEDPSVAAPLKSDGAKTVTDEIGGKTITRSVLPVLIPQGASAVSFKLQGVALGETTVRMSSSLNLVADDMGVLVTNWVERIVQVVEPPSPFVAFNLVDKSGNPLLAPVNCPTGEGYKDYVAALTVTLSKAPTAAVTVHLNPTIRDEEVDIFGETLLGISSTTDGTPWVNTIDSVTFQAGETSKTLYIYGLGASSGTANYGVKFTPSTTGPGAPMFADDDCSHTANLIVKFAKPVIVSPTPADAIEDAMAGQTYKLDVLLEDTYKDMRDEEKGYQFWYRISIGGTTGKWIGPTDLENPTDPFFPDPDSGIGSVDVQFEDEGEGTLEIYMVNADKQDTRVKGQGVKIPVIVSAPKKAWAVLDRPGGYYAEGETAKVRFELSQKTPGSKTYYAFLVPVEGYPDSTTKFNSTGFSTSVPATGGCVIAPGSKDSGDGFTEVAVLDGNASGQYDVFICTDLTYKKTKSAGYAAGRLVINSTNVCPRVESVSMSGYDVTEDGAVVIDPIAQGVRKTFRISVGESEPSQLDKDATGDDAFLTQWKFGTESLDWESVYGNPDLASTATNHVFASPGEHVIQVRVQDKDMRKSGKWSKIFSFKVKVLDAPTITITPALDGKTSYDETDTSSGASKFNVDLSIAPKFADPASRLVLELKVTPLGDTTKYDEGDCVLSKYTIEYGVGIKTGQSFYLKELDGTSESAASGFRITATATAESMALDTEGKKWSAGEIEINVANVNPEIVTPPEQPKDGDKVIAQVTTVGEKLSLAWSIRDVVPDKEAMTVTWTTSEGKKMTYIQGEGADTETVKYLPDVMTGTHEFSFNSSGESKSITMMVQDKDGGVASRTLYYSIAASKTLEIVPHGPPTGNGTALSSRYQDKASGLGAGRVWAANPATIENWIFSFNCGLDSGWRIYGKGYANGETDHREDPDFDYTWNDPDGKDSFLYAWLQIVQEKDAAKPTDDYLAVVPEHREAENSGTLIGLPGEKNEDGSFAKTIAEAIFSREFLVSDNMGDINQDGVPDIYVKKYDFGVFDDAGEVTGDDLKAITVANENGNLDEDFLPAIETSAYGTLIPGLKESWITFGTEFAARTEIRGYHDGLNDAPAQAGITGVKPDCVYEVDDGAGEMVYDAEKCTISELEYLAWREFKATYEAEHGEGSATFDKWSPERPTDPCEKDTDDDGFEDGYEYFFWYRAHVGYMENGVHRYLTGRAYDPKNPGEGRFISAKEIEGLFDPLSAGGDSSSAKLRDTDNDGLPDLLEFMIGTNPIDFDTDGDGLPDGFEIMLGGTDPLLASTTKGVSDAMRNFDGDAMAFTTPYLEANGAVLPKPLVVDSFFTFALVDEKGDTDGIQWYVGRAAPTNFVASAETFSGVSFTLTDRTNVTYVTSRATLPVVDGRLACDLLKSEVRTMISTNDDFGVEGNVNIALMPVLIRAGTPVTNVSETVVEYRTLFLGEDLENASTAWVYGRSVSGETTGDSLANMGGFGMLAIGRYQTAKADLPVAALPAEDDGVAYLHHFVYQEFGFDPRTAWNANTPLAPRWGKTVTTGEGETESTETVANNYAANYGYAGIATRTREFTLYDEFLVLSFFLNNGRLAEADVTPTQAVPWEKIWSKYTTNGQGPNEPNWEPDNEHYKGRTSETASGDNGADTDMDGVPDGWELYVMAGPKVEDKKTKEKLYNLVAPYNDGFFSAFGPFVKEAANASMTDNNATGGRSSAGGDADGLTELQEYAGTDSCAYYCEPWGGNAAPFSATIVRPAEHKLWLNKFFPTDPWNGDTDGDGLGDNEISGNAGKFKYGTPVDDGKLCSIPGGGLNPCTVDTDLDGLPDPWEAQFAGKTVYAGDDAQIMEGKDGTKGNPRQGLCDGMDGTVPDAFNTPHISTSTGSEAETEVIVLNGIAQVVDRDYDKDGLENWQEYMTGAMRVWRYDDPRSSFDWADKAPAGKAGAIVPDGAFFDDLGNFDLAAAMAYTGISDPNEFWYSLLFDRESKWYNPHFITGTAPGTEYFSRVTNGWDQAFTETGSYYIFFDRQNDKMYKDTWGYMGAAPTKYICTSPIDADTDHDGMDDGYELFHGLNPLLGAAAVLASEQGPCDIVFDAWYKRPVGSPIDALNNKWTSGRIPADFDFTVNPWLNGLVDADPDGDDIRNQDEAIMPLVAPSQTWFHTDPTPLWMTDSSYRDSLVTRFFRMPNALGVVPVPESIKIDDGSGEKEYFTRDLDGYVVLPLIGPAIAPFTLEYWDVPLAYAPNWMYSFEENEGYDTDHDAGSDFEELQGKVRSKTDPQDADSPRRRQAMYFPGPAEPSALQTMPFVHELYPRAASGYPDDLSFLQYTVECWVRPGSTADATVLERTSYVHPSHVADERYVRRNFAIMIRGGKWCTEFDANGTLDASTVRVLGKSDVKPGEWTYVAATYDANNLILYVNGGEDGRTASSLKPEYGSSAVVVYPAGSTLVSTNGAGEGADIVRSGDHSYWFDSEYSLNAFLIGASFTNGDGRQLDVTAGMGWRGRYADFFTGYVDEIRVWDGAQSADVISANYATRKRYTREDAIANRNAFYDEWIDGKLRYRKDGSGKDMDVVPELRFHWTFDSLPGAENAKRVLQAPHGFLDQSKPRASRPLGYEVPWWSGIVGAYKSVYAGERNWVPWIPNTVTHLPRFDGSTLDSAYWSEDAAGDEPGIYRFARTAEPVSKWTQMVRNLTESSLQFQTGNRRYWHSYNTGTNGTSMLSRLFEFTGRHLNQTGDDLLPLGGAFAKYVDTMWDDQGASTLWEQTGVDVDNDGLPDWWQEYAEQNFREGVPSGTDITWDTMIWYEVGGTKIRMTAGEAYLRDLAKGTYVDAAGKVQIGPTDYIQTADADANGIPDWWAEMYGIRGESGLADHDNDGLPNYVEYLLSEVFAFKTIFDPTVPDSVQRGVPDYFYRPAGCQLYVGEIFTDHDLVDDAWEDLYDEKYASRLAWDALADADQDGWSNRSENRYSKAVLAIRPDKQAHYTSTDLTDESDGRIADYPIPTISLTLHYNGNRLEEIAKSPVVVQMTRGGNLTKEFDATFKVEGITVTKDESKDISTTSKDDTNDDVGSLKRYIGRWSNRHVLGTLTPGHIKRDSVQFEFAYLPSSTSYSWKITTGGTGGIIAKRGTQEEYNNDLRKFGKNVKLDTPDTDYHVFEQVELRADDEGGLAIWFLPKTGTSFGTLDLDSGAFDIDLGAFTGMYVTNPSNSFEAVSLEDQTFRISYWANTFAELPRKLYLGETETGHVREGLNDIIAFADLNNDGVWQVGEPYGIVRDVDISWRGTTAEIELTDISPVTPRIDLVADDAMPRQTRADIRERIEAHPDVNTPTILKWLDGNPIADRTAEGESFRGQRVRVVRWMINDMPVFLADVDAKVVLDKTIETDVRSILTEADFLVGNESFDIDWDSFYKDVIRNTTAYSACGEVTSASYLVVIGDGDVDWNDFDTSNTVYALNTVITRKFGETRVTPVAVAPGATGEEIVRSANPTFKWTMACPEEEGYTAFNVQVLDGQKVIYDSDKVLAPPRNDQRQYVWSAPLFVGDRTLQGEVFENKKAYTWKVSMYNAKYSNTAAYSNAGRFFMEVQTNGYDYGSANVAVRYFGPTSTWSKKNPVIRVRAYTSPDFTGLPVAAGYVAAPDDPANGLLAGTNAAPNCTVVGIPRGTYYLQAFIDSNGNGACDPWETQGYLCTRDGSKPDYLDPTAITFDSKIGKGDLAIIYLEDADTDGDGLPDAWEYAEYGSLTAKGTELLTETKAGEFVVNTKLTGALDLQKNAKVPTAGLAGEIGSRLSNVGFLALAMGAPIDECDGNFMAAIEAALAPELEEGGVSITELGLKDGKVTIALAIATTSGAESPLAKLFDANGKLTVVCEILWTPTLAQEPKVIYATDIVVGDEPVELDISEAIEKAQKDAGVSGDSAFFSAKVYKK